MNWDNLHARFAGHRGAAGTGMNRQDVAGVPDAENIYLASSELGAEALNQGGFSMLASPFSDRGQLTPSVHLDAQKIAMRGIGGGCDAVGWPTKYRELPDQPRHQC